MPSPSITKDWIPSKQTDVDPPHDLFLASSHNRFVANGLPSIHSFLPSLQNTHRQLRRIFTDVKVYPSKTSITIFSLPPTAGFCQVPCCTLKGHLRNSVSRQVVLEDIWEGTPRRHTQSPDLDNPPRPFCCQSATFRRPARRRSSLCDLFIQDTTSSVRLATLGQLTESRHCHLTFGLDRP